MFGSCHGKDLLLYYSYVSLLAALASIYSANIVIELLVVFWRAQMVNVQCSCSVRWVHCKLNCVNGQ